MGGAMDDILNTEENGKPVPWNWLGFGVEIEEGMDGGGWFGPEYKDPICENLCENSEMIR